VTFTVTGTVPAETTGTLVNTATITAPAGTTDPFPGDNDDNDVNPSEEPIPTINEWGMIIVSLLLAGIGYTAIRRREFISRLTR
jgi:hypothetical protein